MLTEKQIEDCAAVLRNAEEAEYRAGEEKIAARGMYEDAEAQAIQEGRVVGKNDEQRKAAAAVLLHDLIDAVRIAEADHRYAAFMLRQAEIEWKAQDRLLRLAEVSHDR